MNLENIETLLESIYKMSFLVKFETIKTEEKEYRNSEFYKKHKISLQELYVLYEKHKSVNSDLKAKIQELLLDFDTNLIWVKVIEFIQNYENFDEVKELLGDLMNQFDVKSLEPFTKNLEEQIKKVK